MTGTKNDQPTSGPRSALPTRVWILVLASTVAACSSTASTSTTVPPAATASTTTTLAQTTTTATTTTTSTPTTLDLVAEFSARARAICEAAGEEIAAFGFRTEAQFSEVEEAGTYQEMADYMEGVSNVWIDAVDQLRELNPPPEQAEVIGEYLSAVDEQTELVTGYVAALRAEDLTGWDILSTGHAAEAKAANLAHQAGLAPCTSLEVP